MTVLQIRLVIAAISAALLASAVLGLKCRDCSLPDCTNSSVCEADYCSYTEYKMNTSTITYRCSQIDDMNYPGYLDPPPDHMGKCIKGERNNRAFALKICNDTDFCNMVGCTLEEPPAPPNGPDGGNKTDPSDGSGAGLTAYSAGFLLLVVLAATC